MLIPTGKCCSLSFYRSFFLQPTVADEGTRKSLRTDDWGRNLKSSILSRHSHCIQERTVFTQGLGKGSWPIPPGDSLVKREKYSSSIVQPLVYPYTLYVQGYSSTPISMHMTLVKLSYKTKTVWHEIGKRLTERKEKRLTGMRVDSVHWVYLGCIIYAHIKLPRSWVWWCAPLFLAHKPQR